jgi:transposase
MLRLNLTEEEQFRLEAIHKTHPTHRVRTRAQSLLLLSKGYSRTEVATLLSKRLDTISDWFKQYNSDRNWNLEDKPGRGRKPKISRSLKKK